MSCQAIYLTSSKNAIDKVTLERVLRVDLSSWSVPVPSQRKYAPIRPPVNHAGPPEFKIFEIPTTQDDSYLSGSRPAYMCRNRCTLPESKIGNFNVIVANRMLKGMSCVSSSVARTVVKSGCSRMGFLNFNGSSCRQHNIFSVPIPTEAKASPAHLEYQYFPNNAQTRPPPQCCKYLLRHHYNLVFSFFHPLSFVHVHGSELCR